MTGPADDLARGSAGGPANGATKANGAARGAAGRPVALDLGTARTRTVAPGGVTVLDRPSCVPSQDDPAEQVWPIRHGMVSSMAACHRLARAVLNEAAGHAGLAGRGLERVILGVPVAATDTERRAARAAVARAAGCPVVLVEEPLAAAIGCGVDVTDSRPRLLLDVGAGIVEAVVIRDAAVAEAGALQISARTRGGLPGHAVEAVIDLVAGLVRRLPPYLRPAARAGGLLLTGGGAMQQDLAARLCAGLRVSVHPATRPAHATIRGLARLCLMPDLAGRVTENPVDHTKGRLT
jgi:rod shape-determining protein MreB